MTEDQKIQTPGAVPIPGVTEADEHDEHPGRAGDLNEALIGAGIWTDELVGAAGIPIYDVPFVTVGGGIGSFVLADVLRIAGVQPASIRVLGTTDTPWETYQYLTEVSQIPAEERLRSDSGSMPDNIWGFPSFAVREAFGARAFPGFVAPLFQVLTEPFLTDYYTPKVGQVFRGMYREANRIDWWSMVSKGLVRMCRRRHGGGYFTILTPPPETAATKRIAFRSAYVHLAVGYPGVRFLPDLQEYRARHRDFSHVVNAYEPHEHVYEEMLRRGGTVLVRGSGIVASRVLQRLIDDRDHRGAQTTIVHLFRTYVDKPEGESVLMRRPGGGGFSYQGFNFPKAAWGGQLKFALERLEGEERKQLIDVMAGTTTPRRKLWRQQLARGQREGFYRQYVGEVEEVVPGTDRSVVTRIRSGDARFELSADFVVDATGLEADIREHRLLKDLLDQSGAGRNPVGRLDVERTFEVRGTRSEPGRMYASGSATLGGYYAGVDSFLGLQYAALTIGDDLARAGFCKRIGVGRSIAQWWRWAFNKKI